jgi:hypothetical protein
MNKHALIIYCSRGGNTEKVAMRFKEVIERKGAPWGNWDCDTLKLTRQTNFNNLPFKPKDSYDLVLLGSLIIDGIPAHEMFHNAGWWKLLQNPKSSFQGIAPITELYGMKKGIVFVTYTDGRRGTKEAMPCLDLLEMRMEDLRIRCIGKFSCTGSGHHTYRWVSPNNISDVMHISLDGADAALRRYMENPNYPEFTGLTPEQRKVFETEAHADPNDGHLETVGTRDLVWDVENKPNERDLMKAQYFLEEILENYFGGGIEAAPLCQYLCIA